MANPHTCPVCGAALPADAPDQPCPACLMKLGLQSWHSRAEDDSGGDAGPTRLSPGGFEPPLPEEIAAHFPQLEIIELIGHGGMGAVYKARQRNLDRLVALKIIRPESADDASFAERFAREAKALARLSHPHIVTVHDFGEVGPVRRSGPVEESLHADRGPDGPSGPAKNRLYYFLMEYVDGVNLRQLLEAGQLDPQQALSIVPKLCDALQYAHDEGVVHRDIKPENILIEQKGRVKIADFGLAKLAHSGAADVSLTGTHQIMGTPRYMAPEQMEGSRSVDHRADIYSLGVVFYELLTGELPIGRFEPPSKKVQVDVRLDEVVLRTLEQQPDRRYQNASDVRTDIERISGSSNTSRPQDVVATSVPETSINEQVLREIRNPSIGLFITGICYWLTIPLGFGLWTAGFFGKGVPLPTSVWWFFIMQPALAGVLLMFGSLRMKRLEGYRFAAAAAITPLVIFIVNLINTAWMDSFGFGPGDLIGPTMGLWALAVLSRVDVRAAFERTVVRGDSDGQAQTTSATDVEAIARNLKDPVADRSAGTLAEPQG